MGCGARELLEEVGRRAIGRIDPEGATRAAVRRAGIARARVLAVGKAAGPMADGAAAGLGEVLAGSFATVPDGAPAARAEGIETWRAGHPLPDARSAAAGAEALARVADGVPWILCVSGGASALWFVPAEGLTVAGGSELTAALLQSGRGIAEMNEVRRKASRVAGGGLLRAAARGPERVLVLSDVPGDDPAIVGSGPCWPDGGAGAPRHEVIGSNRTLVAAAEEELETRGVRVVERAADEDGPAEALAQAYGAAAREWSAARAATAVAAVAGTGTAVAAVGGGEARVAVSAGAAAGRGGRCTHLALLVARAIAGIEGAAFGAIASDGVDGASRAAGAIVDGATWGAGADAALARFDAAGWLDERGALLAEKPTGVNVRDLYILFFM
jgi:hydroxypyruvate reductase